MKYLTVVLLFSIIWNFSFAQEKNLKADSVKVYNFNELDKAPEYIDGEKQLGKFVSQSIEYPQEALNDKEGGLAIVSIIIDEHGKVSNPKIIRSAVKTIPTTIRKDLNDEAIRVIMLTNGKWTPGEVKGQNVSSFYLIPIRFTPPKSIKNKK